jgi:minichromosome maintenance protein 10
MCPVLKRDGKPCGSWCDKRASDVCEYHIQNAVERRRAERAEFSAGYVCFITNLFMPLAKFFSISTSGLTTTGGPKRKPAYDPARQWGLKPDDSGGRGETYVISGHIVTGSGTDSRSLLAIENIGREGQAKARRAAEKDADRELKALLQRDRDGMKAVVKARDVGSKGAGKEVRNKDKGEKNKKKPNPDSMEVENRAADNAQTTVSSSYSASVIRGIGFDPSLKPGQRRVDDTTLQDKV